MSDTSAIGFPEAARRFGVPLRVLRRAIRAGHIPAPPNGAATAPLPAEWMAKAEEKVAAEPHVFSRASTQKIPPFARYRGTSAWTKYRARVREFAQFRAETGKDGSAG